MRTVFAQPRRYRFYFAAFIAAAAASFVFAGASSAEARTYKPTYCSVNHDHRSHAANYYTYYPKDNYYRAGDYRPRKAYRQRSNRYDRNRYERSRYPNRYDNRYRNNRKYNNGRRGSTVVRRDVIPARGRSRIVVTEEVIYGRGRPYRICTVAANGPDSRYIPYNRLRNVASRSCSRGARVNIRS